MASHTDLLRLGLVFVCFHNVTYLLIKILDGGNKYSLVAMNTRCCNNCLIVAINSSRGKSEYFKLQILEFQADVQKADSSGQFLARISACTQAGDTKLKINFKGNFIPPGMNRFSTVVFGLPSTSEIGA